MTRAIAEREGLTLVPPYDDYLIMAGQGTCALELLEEVPDLDSLVTPCSGGGLFAGTSTAVKALKPEARCFAVEPETGNDTLLSIQRGERVEIPPPPTIADGARVQTPGQLTFPITRSNTEKVLTVSDAEIVEAMRFILLRMKLLVEPTGALGAAAVLSGKLPTDVRKVGVVLSGGNVDAEMLKQLL
jgi:threonine dehydratase